MIDEITEALPQELIEQLSRYSVAAILDAIVKPTVATVRRYGPFGNVFFRPMDFEKVGSVVIGHTHHYAHVTYLTAGSLNVQAWEIDPRSKKRIGKMIERQYRAPAVILIEKNWEHRFVALEDYTRADCIFALRDYKGEPTDQWDGSLQPYC